MKGEGTVQIHRSGSLQLSGAVIAIGAFDGVHKGHQKVIQQTVAKSKLLGVPSVIYTFDPPPRAFFQGAKVLSNQINKMNKLSSLGVDHTVIATFDAEYLNRTPESFIEELGMMNPLGVIVGNDFRFGHKRKGDINLLKSHYHVEMMTPVCCASGERISSTRIRELILEGELDQAISLLS
jgi:riboflavin kinase/FMN adenylyltransferase